MKTIISGSREIQDYQTVSEILYDHINEISEIVNGTARGVDSLSRIWAIANKIPIKDFPANWIEYGKSAGYRRNLQMADYADCLIAIWDGKSKGTKHMIDIMEKKNKPTKVYIIES